ncbi:sensor histidine kinase [Rhodopirellula sp. SWK7]|uniref:sensor histidine kinase n=1 Tax=Rhodopirellula sp. SWK7 TaxID=595460 RepID=UPI0002BED750|nr:ATP-binding protein [Rhodopirellula sp. SWK7]EMI46524.1 membrane protein containing ATP-binding region, ATPase-like domain protein [Rhodopirellula sp. SWK7]
MMYPSEANSLKRRLHIGTGLLVAICLLSNVIGWFGQEVLLSNFRAIESSDQIATEVLQVNQGALQLKASAENYAQTGADAQYNAAHELQSQLLAAIDGLKKKVGESDPLTDKLDQMRELIAAFGDQLQLASAERNVRTDLFQNKLLHQESEVDDSLAKLEKYLVALDENDASRRLLVAVRAFSTARKNMLRYFIQPSSDDYERMLDSLKESQSEVRRIELPADDQDAADAKQRVLTALANFQSLGVRAVQATRGYMFYVNVVMAGQISEFVHYSNEIKELVGERREASRAARQWAVTRSRVFGVLAAALAVMIAAILAFRLSKVIFDPISNLTKTFLRLAQGETIESIPAVGRNDEIGRMARAAEVFSRKNQQTKELLQRSQSLSEELSQKAVMLEESNQELDNFAYVASHDLKSPLRGLRCLAEWVQEDCEGLLSEDSQKHLLQMQGRVTKMESLLDDLLSYSRVGRTAQRVEKVDVNELIDSVLDIMDVSNGVQISVDCDLPIIETFKTPLQQVLLNLIANAIKYNDKGPDGRIQVTGNLNGGMVEFAVIDNGIGIAPRFHERIFQMYQRASSLQVEGSGMGLAIVKKQIEIVGGEIHVDSSEGQGSTFSFTWPLQKSGKVHDVSASSSA